MRVYFPNLFKNEHTKSRICEAILENKLSHALLISGPVGSGKSTLATEICAALNCENKYNESTALPCRVCNTCRRIYEGKYTDVKALIREKSKATVGVEEVRLLREDMFLSATESSYKIYIFNDADRMTVNAQNALLKVLEEPPENVVILLLCSQPDAILTTVKSRAQSVVMQRFTTDEILQYLKVNRPSKVSDPAIADKIMAADGRIGRALEIIESPDEVERDRRCVTEIIEAFALSCPYSRIYSALSALPRDRSELGEIFEMIMLGISDLIKVKNIAVAPLSFFSDREKCKRLADSVTLRKLTEIYDAVNDAAATNQKNVNISALITDLGAKIKMI